MLTAMQKKTILATLMTMSLSDLEDFQGMLENIYYPESESHESEPLLFTGSSFADFRKVIPRAICKQMTDADQYARRLMDEAHGILADLGQLVQRAIDKAEKEDANNRLNKALAEAGIVERVMQGRGYVYFVKGEASAWPSSSIPVCYMRDLTPESVIENWKMLSGNERTPNEPKGRGQVR